MALLPTVNLNIDILWKLIICMMQPPIPDGGNLGGFCIVRINHIATVAAVIAKLLAFKILISELVFANLDGFRPDLQRGAQSRAIPPCEQAIEKCQNPTPRNTLHRRSKAGVAIGKG